MKWIHRYIDPSNPPRLKGKRNPAVIPAVTRNSGGPMRDRRMRRSKDARRSWQREEQS